MSCVCILTPIVIAAWPAFSAAVVSAAATLGYVVVASEGAPVTSKAGAAEETPSQLTLEIPNSEIVTDQLGREQHITVRRGDVTVTFARDARGRATICVTGAGHDKETLQRLGEELSQRVVQRYVYQRLKAEMSARDFVVVEEETDATHAIRLKVRHWEN